MLKIPGHAFPVHRAIRDKWSTICLIGIFDTQQHTCLHIFNGISACYHLGTGHHTIQKQTTDNNSYYKVVFHCNFFMYVPEVNYTLLCFFESLPVFFVLNFPEINLPIASPSSMPFLMEGI